MTTKGEWKAVPVGAASLGHPRRGIRTTVALGVPAPGGLIAALLMPRGAVTSGQALVLMGLGLIVGLVAGPVLRSRWALLLAPAVHAVAFEQFEALHGILTGTTVPETYGTRSDVTRPGATSWS